MAKNVDPIFAFTPFSRTVRISGAGAVNTNRDGTSGTLGTTIFLLVTAGAAGARIDKITGVAAGTVAATTAGMLRFWKAASSGTDWQLIAELAVTVVTPSATVKGWTDVLTFVPPIHLEASERLLVSSEKANATGDQFIVRADGGDFLVV